jgi:hypothetical protein
MSPWTCPQESDVPGCIAVRRTGPPARCANCKAGRENEELAAALLSSPPIAQSGKPATKLVTKLVIEKRETPLAKTDSKEKILALITRKGPCPSTPILQNCSSIRAEELHQLTEELAAAGQIVIWTDGRKKIYTLPGAPDPFAGKEKQAAPSNDATVTSKTPRRVNRTPATPPSNPRAKSERTVSTRPSPRKPAGNGAFVVAIAELEARRTAALDQVEQIDTAISTLRALA